MEGESIMPEGQVTPETTSSRSLFEEMKDYNAAQVRVEEIKGKYKQMQDAIPDDSFEVVVVTEDDDRELGELEVKIGKIDDIIHERYGSNPGGLYHDSFGDLITDSSSEESMDQHHRLVALKNDLIAVAKSYYSHEADEEEIGNWYDRAEAETKELGKNAKMDRQTFIDRFKSTGRFEDSENPDIRDGDSEENTLVEEIPDNKEPDLLESNPEPIPEPETPPAVQGSEAQAGTEPITSEPVEPAPAEPTSEPTAEPTEPVSAERRKRRKRAGRERSDFSKNLERALREGKGLPESQESAGPPTEPWKGGSIDEWNKYWRDHAKQTEKEWREYWQEQDAVWRGVDWEKLLESREEKARKIIEEVKQKEGFADVTEVKTEHLLNMFNDSGDVVAAMGAGALVVDKPAVRAQLVKRIDEFRNISVAYRMISKPEDELSQDEKDFLKIMRHLDHLAAEITTADLPRREKELSKELKKVLVKKEKIVGKIREGILPRQERPRPTETGESESTPLVDQTQSEITSQTETTLEHKLPAPQKVELRKGHAAESMDGTLEDVVVGLENGESVYIELENTWIAELTKRALEDPIESPDGVRVKFIQTSMPGEFVQKKVPGETKVSFNATAKRGRKILGIGAGMEWGLNGQVTLSNSPDREGVVLVSSVSEDPSIQKISTNPQKMFGKDMGSFLFSQIGADGLNEKYTKYIKDKLGDKVDDIRFTVTEDGKLRIDFITQTQPVEETISVSESPPEPALAGPTTEAAAEPTKPSPEQVESIPPESELSHPFPKREKEDAPEVETTYLGKFSSEYNREQEGADYDDSFSIETPTGEFLGECGVGPIYGEDGKPEKGTVFDLWLFDQINSRVKTIMLMSEHAYDDDELKAKLNLKGDLLLAEPGETIAIETEGLILNVRIDEMRYMESDSVPNEFFDRLKFELDVWEKKGKELTAPKGTETEEVPGVEIPETEKQPSGEVQEKKGEIGPASPEMKEDSGENLKYKEYMSVKMKGGTEGFIRCTWGENGEVYFTVVDKYGQATGEEHSKGVAEDAEKLDKIIREEIRKAKESSGTIVERNYEPKPLPQTEGVVKDAAPKQPPLKTSETERDLTQGEIGPASPEMKETPEDIRHKEYFSFKGRGLELYSLCTWDTDGTVYFTPVDDKGVEIDSKIEIGRANDEDEFKRVIEDKKSEANRAHMIMIGDYRPEYGTNIPDGLLAAVEKLKSKWESQQSGQSEIIPDWLLAAIGENSELETPTDQTESTGGDPAEVQGEEAERPITEPERVEEELQQPAQGPGEEVLQSDVSSGEQPKFIPLTPEEFRVQFPKEEKIILPASEFMGGVDYYKVYISVTPKKGEEDEVHYFAYYLKESKLHRLEVDEKGNPKEGPRGTKPKKIRGRYDEASAKVKIEESLRKARKAKKGRTITPVNLYKELPQEEKSETGQQPGQVSVKKK